MMGVMASPLEVPAADSVVPEEEFNRWMLSEQRRIFLLCYRMLRDRDEADMATQDAFVKAHRAMRRSIELEDRTKWVTRIAVNTCLDRLRSRSWKFWKRRPQPGDEALILDLTPSGQPDAEAQLFAREIERRLAEAMEQLSPQQRAVFTLRHFEDRQLDEIAGLLGLEVGTVKAHMARALAKLRGLLKDLYIRRESVRTGGKRGMR